MFFISVFNSVEKDGLTLTAWVQWTINKLAIKLYVMGQPNIPSVKLVLDLEDIITSLDLQPVYLKLKTKITTATIFNYIRLIDRCDILSLATMF